MAGVSENFRSSSTLLKIGAILIVIAFIAHVVCFSIPHWMVLNSSINEVIDDIFDEYKVHTGLWKVCSCASVLGYEQCACLDWPIVPSWLAGVRAALNIGLILLIVSTGAVLIQLFCKQDKRLQIAGILGSAVAGISIAIGIAIYVVFKPKEYAFKFCIWICAVASLACWISIAFLIADRKKQRSTPSSNQPNILYQNAGQPAQPGYMKSIQYSQTPMQQPQQHYGQQQPKPYTEITGQYGQQSGQYGQQPGHQWSPSGQYTQQPGQQVHI